MQDLQVEVRRAQLADLERIQHLAQQSRRSCVRFGYEDLVRMIEHDYCFIADTGALLWGFICATAQQRVLAQIRGVVLINGWRVDTGLTHLLQPLEAALSEDGHRFLMHLALESWLVPPLIRQDYATHDYIINFERDTPARPLIERHQPLQPCHLRSLASTEIGALTVLDNRCFDWPWQFTSGELVKLLLTTSRLVVLDCGGALGGYSCVDIHGSHAQIIRIAVDPSMQRNGYGRFLLADALDYVANQGAETVSLNTQWHNQTSQRLYQGFGFRAVGRRIPVLIKQLKSS